MHRLCARHSGRGRSSPDAPGNGFFSSGRPPEGVPKRRPRHRPSKAGGAAYERPETERLFVAVFRMGIPGSVWTVPFSKAHPEVRIQMMNRLDAGPTSSLGDWWIRGGGPGQWTDEIAGFPDVLKIEPTSTIEGGTIYRITISDPPEIQMFRRLGLVLPLPVWIQAGQQYWEAAATHADAKRMQEATQLWDPPARIHSLRRSPLRSRIPNLTSAERRLFQRARAEGYYAMPPGHISLVTLAHRLHRRPAVLARGLSGIDAKILKSSLVHPESVRRLPAGFTDASGRRVASPFQKFQQYLTRIEPR